MNKRNSCRIRNSFRAVAIGWLVPFSALTVWLLVIAIYVAIVEGVSAITDGGMTVLPVFLVAAFFVSVIVTLTGWILIGIPLALAISDRQIRRRWFMVLIHATATVIATITLALLLELFDKLGLGRSFFADLYDFVFVAGWAAITGSVGGWKFWALQRSP